MSRQIKFRAWDTMNNRMVESPWRFEPMPAYILESEDYQDEMYRTGYRYYDDFSDEEDGIWRPCHLMQFTGLQDKECRDIYEGDLLRVHIGHPDNQALLWQVEFYYGAFQARPVGKSGRLAFLNMAIQCFEHSEGFYEHEQLQDYLEIVGNIYENPEMLTHVSPHS